MAIRLRENVVGVREREVDDFLTSWKRQGEQEYIDNRDLFLNYINEERKGVDTYKKYVIINIKASEAYNICTEGLDNVILKYIPKWVIDQINKGEAVEALLFMQDTAAPIGYYKSSDSDSIIKKIHRKRDRVFGDCSEQYVEGFNKMNDTVFAKINITNIIKTQIQNNGKYDNNITIIANKRGKKEEDIIKYGKRKPLYYIELSDLFLLPTQFYLEKNERHGIFMTKFNVEVSNSEEGIKYELKPEKFLTEVKNAATVWV